MITYIIQDTLSGMYKIGKSRRFKERLSTMRTSNLHLSVIMLIMGDEEKILHRIFKHLRVEKEWYSLSLEDLQALGEYQFDCFIETNS